MRASPESRRGNCRRRCARRFTPLLGEQLETRLPLALGDLVATLDAPFTLPQDGAYFGNRIAVDGAYTVIGALQADVSGVRDTGIAYVYNTTTGALLRTLNNPAPTQTDFFGESVAISGTTVVVGAYFKSSGVGAVYVFDAASGNLLRTINNPVSQSSWFGASVAISGTMIVVGASHGYFPNHNEGLVYVFDATTGNLVRTLTGPTSGAPEGFGASVAISGNTIVVGSPQNSTKAVTGGAAYLFDASTGSLQHTLFSPTPTANEQFGAPVQMSAGLVVAHSFNPATLGGGVYVFDAASGSFLRNLSEPSPSSGDEFGQGLAMSGTTVIVGAPGHQTGSPISHGTVFAYDANSGALLNTYLSPGAGVQGTFGDAVALVGSTIIVGSSQQRTGALTTGAVYMLDVGGALLNTLVSPIPSDNDGVGLSVATAGNLVVVGNNTIFPGRVYVFDATTGNLLQTLLEPAATFSRGFGHSVAISGTTVVVGADHELINVTSGGAVYVYDATTGGLLRTINNPAPANNDNFGSAVAILGNTIVVGANQDDAVATDAGTAYLFDLTTGNLLKTINDPLATSGDSFGSSIAMSSNGIVIGAPKADSTATDSGGAYLYDLTGKFLKGLNNPSIDPGDVFGTSVAISANMIVVGSPSNNLSAQDAGRAFLYDGTGSFIRSLADPAPEVGDSFGSAVAFAGNTVVVGADFDNTGAAGAGAAYIFDSYTGGLLRTLTNPSPFANDNFGFSAAAGSSAIVIGAPNDNGAAIDRGVAYVYGAGSGTTIYLNSSGNLNVIDSSAGGKNDNLKVSFDALNYTIQDTTSPTPNVLTVVGIAGATGSGTSTVTIPAGSIPGSQFIFNTGDGNDALTIDLSGANPIRSGGITFNGGNPATLPGDKLVLQGGVNTTRSYTYTSATDGKVVIGGLSGGPGTVNYTGLEGVTDLGPAQSETVTLPAGGSSAILEDDGTVGNGLSQLRSTSGAFPVMTFSNSTTSLAVLRGNAADTLTVNALPDFSASLSLGQSGSLLSSISFAGPVSLAGNSSLGAAAQTITTSAGAPLATSAGVLNMVATGSVALGDALTTGGGDITVQVNVGNVSGAFSTGSAIAAGTGAITITADDMALGGAITTTGMVTLLPAASDGVDLGATTDGQPSVLELSDAELDRVTAGTLQIGNASSSTITVTAPITNPNTLSLTNNAAINVNQPVTLASGKNFMAATAFSLNLAASGAINVSGGGSVSVAANGMGVDPAAAINAGTGVVSIDRLLAGREILLGSENASKLSLTDAELDRITAGTLRIGNSALAGQITISAPITLADNATPIPTLHLLSHGAVIDANPTGTDITVASLALEAANGPSTATTLSTQTASFAASYVSSGSLRINNAGALTVSTVDGIAGVTNTGGGIIVAATGGLTVAADATSVSGPIQLTAAGDDQLLTINANVASQGDGALTADKMSILHSISFSGMVTLAPESTVDSNDVINLGSATDAAPNALELSNAELSNVLAANVQIGDGSSGAITVTSDITFGSLTAVQLTSGGVISFAAGSISTAGGSLRLAPGMSAAVGVPKAGTDVNLGSNGTLTFASLSSLALAINGTTPDSQYEQLNVVGKVDLTGVNLALTGNFVPLIGQGFTLINNDGTDAVIGAFNNLPEGKVFSLAGSLAGDFTISYHGGDGSDVVATATNIAPTLDAISDPSAILEDSGAHAIGLTGIGAGGTLSQTLTVTATSSNPALIPNPQVAYTSGSSTASISYTPVGNASGTALITVTVKDDGGTASGSDTISRTFTVSVTPVNDPPVSANATATAIEDTTYTFSEDNFPFGDPDDANPPSSTGPNGFQNVIITTLPSNGTLVLNGSVVTSVPVLIPVTGAASIASGGLQFRPDANKNSAQTGSPAFAFTFKVQDDGGTNSGGVDTSLAANTFTFTVQSVNDPPQASDNTFATQEDTDYVFHYLSDNNNDFGFQDLADLPNPNSFANVIIASAPAKGQLFSGAQPLSVGATVPISAIASGLFKFHPQANANGNPYDSFAFEVQDDGVISNVSLQHTITIVVTPVHDPPTGANKTITILEDQVYSFSGVGVSDFGFSDANDLQFPFGLSSVPPDAFVNVIFPSAPTNGSLYDGGVDSAHLITTFPATVSAAELNGNLKFVPAANKAAVGGATFSVPFKVQDSGGINDISFTVNTITFSVTAVSDAPRGADNTTITINENRPVAPSSYVFQSRDFGFVDPNDLGPNGGSPIHVGGDSFVSLLITSDPVGGKLLNGASEVHGSPSSPVAVSDSSINSGQLKFVPTPHWNSAMLPPTAFSFSFRVKDDGGTANGGVDTDQTNRVFSLTVISINDPPQGTDRGADLLEDSSYTLQAADFPFADPDDSPASAFVAVVITSLPSGSALELDGAGISPGQAVSPDAIAGGNVTFTPLPDVSGDITFTFQLQDDGGTALGGSNLDPLANTFTMHVMGVNDAPSFVKGNDKNATDESGAVSFAGWATAISAGPYESAQKVHFVVQSNSNASLFAAGPAIDATGKLTFTPAPNVAGSAQIGIVLMDDGGTANQGVDASAIQSFTINISKAHVWHNAANRLDVNGDTHVSAGDALDVINFINAFGSPKVPTDGRTTGPYRDVNGDGTIAPGDALDVINAINAGQGSEGEDNQRSGVGNQGSTALADDLFAMLAADVAVQTGGSRTKRV